MSSTSVVPAATWTPGALNGAVPFVSPDDAVGEDLGRPYRDRDARLELGAAVLARFDDYGGHAAGGTGAAGVHVPGLT